MTIQWDFRKQLAAHLDGDQIDAAVALLHEQARYFLELAETHKDDAPSCSWLDDRTRWLINAAFALPDIQALELGIRKQRKQIKDAELELLGALRLFHERVKAYAQVARRLVEAGMDTPYHYPASPSSNPLHYGYTSPLLFLQAFENPRYPTLIGGKCGKPATYETIECEPYDYSLIVLVALDPEWERYLHDCLEYFHSQFKLAQSSLSTNMLFEISLLASKKPIENFDSKKLVAQAAAICEIYKRREKIKLAIQEKTTKIDYFYDALACCESSMFISPIFLPGWPTQFIGQPPAGMPYYERMHPYNVFYRWEAS